MKLVHLVPKIDQEAAGPSYSVPRLCQSLAACGNEVELACLAARGEISGVALSLYSSWPILKRFEVSTSLGWALGGKAWSADVVHNHSLWSMVNVAAGWMVPGRRAKLVVSPRGTLSSWALSRQQHVKRVLWPLQKRVLARADLLHATSQVELAEIRALGLDAPVAVIPNGIDLPVLQRGERLRCERMRTLLFLSRIHPTKAIDRLLAAWVQLQARHPDWRLVIAGRGESGHVEETKALAKKLCAERVEFPGPLFGDAKAEAYCNADLFVLPTHSENFGMVVAEALSHGCPAVVSRGAPWAGLEAEGCGWWVENSVDGLETALGAAMQLPELELQTMGLHGRAWMERDFGWAAIGEKMDAAYRWLVQGGDRPAWVSVA